MALYLPSMRVVAGSARGRKLIAPAGRNTRPTSDRVRQATFNALHSLGAVEGAAVLDLYAGSGAMGIEALSRGAAAATFVDDDRLALIAVRANLTSTGLGDLAEVVQADARTWVASASAFDLAVLDPPYTTTDAAWTELLDVVRAETLVLESDRELPSAAGWEVLRVGRYGGTVVTLARHEKGRR